MSFTNSFTPAHQIAGATISNTLYKYGPPASGTDVYPAVNNLNQYTAMTPAGGSARPITYDTRGNLACAGTGCPTTIPSATAWVYTYDALNRMLTAGNGTVAAVYAYDPLGRRTTKTVGTTVTNFLHDGDSEIGEYNAAGNVQRRFVPGPAIDQPIAMVTVSSGVKTMFHTDKLGSVVAMSNASDGHLAAGPFNYDSWGNCVSGGSACSTAGTPFLYTGQRLDPETGLYYYRARYYSAPLGRFMQTDSIGYKDGINWYAYVGNDPTDKTDPTGLSCTSATSGNKTVYSCKIDEVAVYQNGHIVGFRPPTEAETKSFATFNAHYTAAVNSLAERAASGDSEKSATIPNLTGGKGGFTITVGEALDSAVQRQVNFVGDKLGPKRELATDGGPGMGRDPVTYVGNVGLKASEAHIIHDVGIHGTAAENRGGLQTPQYPLSKLDQQHQKPYNDAASELLGDDQ